MKRIFSKTPPEGTNHADALIVKCSGASRSVYLIGRWAIKLPSGYSWQMFLYGLLGNIQERRWWRTGWAEAREKLCPVLFADRWGFVLVMPRCEPITGYTNDVFMSHEEHKKWIAIGDCGCVPVENKRSSFGHLKGRLVAVDYGS